MENAHVLRYLRATLVTCSTVLVIALGAAPGAVAAPGRFIVVLNPGASVPAAAARHGAAPTRTFTRSITGYAATLSDAAQARAAADPAVRYLTRDAVVSALGRQGGSGQRVPTGVRRIGGLLSTTAAIDGIDGRVATPVAVIDTGIDIAHPQLNVVGGVNCSTGSSYVDGNGHGSHVAGTIGALDGGSGVVGVAPGVPLYSVRVLNNAGSGSISSIICGVEWVTARAATIKVANMSLGAGGSDDGNCGRTNGDAMHDAICRSVAAGVTYVVAAGNDAVDAATSAPASYDEVITVSALADFNGAAGGGAAATCRTDVDDTLADFSNWGRDVDIAAPGVCIESTWKGGGYNTISGTSMASPHVAGAAALYVATHPGSAPAAVQAGLVAASTPGRIPGDVDGFFEGVLNVASL